jgi:hypothetical protein
MQNRLDLIGQWRAGSRTTPHLAFAVQNLYPHRRTDGTLPSLSSLSLPRVQNILDSTAHIQNLLDSTVLNAKYFAQMSRTVISYSRHDFFCRPDAKYFRLTS